MKLIDWSRVPRGTMTNSGEFLGIKGIWACVLTHDPETGKPKVLTFDKDELRIVPQTHWTYHNGGSCPVPDGLTFEVITRDGSVEIGRQFRWEHAGDFADAISYRITGVNRADGWTDDPSEVTE